MIGKKKFNKHRSKHTINFYSHKNQSHIWCESFLERNYALTLEYDETVARYASQPESFTVYGKRYTPDFLVQYISGFAQYLEVKHTYFMNDEFFEKHERRKQVIFQWTKLDLLLVSELNIDPIENENYDLLKTFKQLDVENLIARLGNIRKKLTLSALEKRVCKLGNFTRAHAWALVAQQYFHFDHSQALSADTILMRGW